MDMPNLIGIDHLGEIAADADYLHYGKYGKKNSDTQKYPENDKKLVSYSYIIEPFHAIHPSSVCMVENDLRKL